MTPAQLWSLSLAVIAAIATAQATNMQRQKIALPRKRTLRHVSRPGKVTKIAMTGIMFVVADGMGATVAATITGISTAQTAHARTRESIATGLARCTCSGMMATATTTTTTAAVAGMVEIVVVKKTITTTAQIAVAMTPSSKATTRAYLNVKSKRGKVMERVTTATTSVAAIGTVAIAVPKQTRICRVNHFCFAMIAHAMTRHKLVAIRDARSVLGKGTARVTTKTITADATGTEGTAVDLKTTITIATIAHVWMIRLSMKILGAPENALCISGKAMENVTTTTMSAVATGTAETAVGTTRTRIHINMAIVRSVSAATRCSIHAMENVRCSIGLGMATATTRTTTAVVIGMAETAAEEREHFCIARNVTALTRITRLRATNHVTKLPGKETKRATMKITTVAVIGTVETAAAQRQITTTNTVPSANV